MAGARLHFGAIAAATLVTVGLWLLLHVLGLAAGIIVPDRGDPESLRAVGFGNGTFAVLAPLLALFVGGGAAARMAGLTDRKVSALHGVLVWGLTAGAGAIAVVAAVAALVGDARPVHGMVAAARSSEPWGGLDLGDMLAPTNARLAQRGTAPVTAPQIRALAADLVPLPSDERRLDRVALVEKLAAATGLPMPEAEQIAGQIERQLSEQRSAAASAFGRPGRAFWGAFVLLLLGLISAAAGASFASGQHQRARARTVVVPAPATARS